MLPEDAPSQLFAEGEVVALNMPPIGSVWESASLIDSDAGAGKL